MSPLVPLMTSVGLGAAAQIALRHSATVRDAGPNSSRRAWPWLALWGACFAMATLLWLAALRHADISYAYPLLGIGYVVVTLLAKFLLGERVSRLRWIAISIITAGVAIVGASR